MIEWISCRKVVLIEDVAAEFGLSCTDALKKI